MFGCRIDGLREVVFRLCLWGVSFWFGSGGEGAYMRLSVLLQIECLELRGLYG